MGYRLHSIILQYDFRAGLTRERRVILKVPYFRNCSRASEGDGTDCDNWWRKLRSDGMYISNNGWLRFPIECCFPCWQSNAIETWFHFTDGKQTAEYFIETNTLLIRFRSLVINIYKSCFLTLLLKSSIFTYVDVTR